MTAILVSVLALLVGIYLSRGLTALGVFILASRTNVKVRLQVTAIKQLDLLLKKPFPAQLSPEERKTLLSAVMQFMMTATSQRIAQRYLDRIGKSFGTLDPQLWAETAAVFKERFPAKDAALKTKDERAKGAQNP